MVWKPPAEQPHPTVDDERPDAELVAAVIAGDSAAFEGIVRRYQSRLFATARRHARREDEVADLVQEIFLKAFSKLPTWRGTAPFEHWLMRLAVRTCYDALRSHQRNREHTVSSLAPEETDWLERHAVAPEAAGTDSAAARTLVNRILEQMSPANRLVITLLELEDRPVKEIAALTGWSVPLVKVRAFRARAEMRRILSRMTRDKFM